MDYRNLARVASGGKSALYLAIFFASALSLAQRFFAAFPIFALAAAESTRLVLLVTFLLVDRPIASAAGLMPFSLCCIDATCFSSLRSSRLIAARMSMNPPLLNLSYGDGHTPDET